MDNIFWFKDKDGHWVKQQCCRKQTKTAISQEDIEMFDYIVYNKYECIVDKIIVKENNQDVVLSDIKIADGTLFKIIQNSYVIGLNNKGTVYIQK